MDVKIQPKNVYTLNPVLGKAEEGGYAVGAFAPRYTKMIKPILNAGERLQSPLIVQISEKELIRYSISPKEFADEFYSVLNEEKITVPVVLHLDHTKHMSVIKEAIAAGFTSIMIDASEHPFDLNVKISKEAVDYAHSKGVSAEAELGKIGTTDFVETDTDEELYTDPIEARQFVEQTGTDALAVSVGTAHGVYKVKKPKVDFERLNEIRKLTQVHLVLHGGSGVPASMVKQAFSLANGGVSKVNIATDLEVAALAALGKEDRMTDQECSDLPEEQLSFARLAVEKTVSDKITHFLESENRAVDFK
ncbi:fructose-bisphosphate aldolase [Scopulibacillus darangshiensis]|uniref:Fructose-bisphosphate aldolase n=1 Tax=Scopulibacillus darangshiensis TaxID=442528 RepID=A0A4R2P414_9BACL|nr:class II fructose-bisphosphate aldolase [Scopulibacillus darangshiensis]TCP29463.1 fructose-bisphosphate aldolase [Scopulibacillus darangshiensis]